MNADILYHWMNVVKKITCICQIQSKSSSQILVVPILKLGGENRKTRKHFRWNNGSVFLF